MRVYNQGLDILGASTGPVTKRALLIRVMNSGQLAGQQGAVASLAASIVPQTVEAKVYDTMMGELAKSLKEKGVEADVSVVEPANWHPAGANPIWQTIAIALGAIDVAVLGWSVYRRFSGGRR